MSVKGLSQGGLLKSVVLLCSGLLLFCALPAFSQPQTERAAAPRFSTSVWAMQVFKSLELEHVNTEGGLEQHLYVNRKILSCQGGACNCEFNKRSVRVEHLGAVLDVGGEFPNIEALCKLDGTPMESLFGGVDLQTLPIGELDLISLNSVQQGTEFEAEDEACFPLGSCSTYHSVVSNPHETDAIVIPHGYPLHWLWAAKGNTGPLPAELTQFIGDYVDENSVADYPLGNKELIVLYDLDTSNGLQYGDAAIRLESCTEFEVPPPPEEVHLRLGGGGETPTCYEEQTPSCTDDRIEIPSYATVNWSSYVVGGAYLSVDSPTVLTGIAGIAVGDSDFEVSELVPKLRIYSSESGFGADPSVGDVYSTDDVGIDLPVPFGGTSQTQGLPYSYVRLTFEPFVLPGPGTYIVSIIHQEPNVDNFHWAHTTTDLGSDIITTNAMHPNYELIETVSGPPGTLAIDFKGYLLP